MPLHLILGTAGHIDHGKTELVKVLTGINGDRLPDEKRRGMTIDLGFAGLQLGEMHLGIVDVPGHERLIRNMLCGAMAIDLVMLVVAASESVKPQTREHLEILKHLAIEHGVVVLTKCDLVEPSWLELVEAEVRMLLTESPLRHASIVRVSSLTGQGLPELRAELTQAAEQAARSPRRQQLHAPFRLAVDRTFSVAGHGTVLTGSVSSGQVAVGQEVAIEPRGRTARVRGLQSHGIAVERVERGQRAAINLAGVPLEEVRRGDVLAEPGYLAASRRLHVELSLSAEACPDAPASDSQRLRKRRKSEVRAHLGTKEIQATLRWLEPPQDGAEDGEGGRRLAELELSEPAACVWGQPVVIRRQSPVATLGGGRVIDPDPRPLGRRTAEALPYLRKLASESPRTRLASLYYFAGVDALERAEVMRRGGIFEPWEPLRDSLVAEQVVQPLDTSPGRVHYLHGQVMETGMARIEQLLRKHHERNRMQMVFPATVLHPIFTRGALAGGDRQHASQPHDFPLSASRLLASLLERMRSTGRVTVTPTGVALPGCGPQLSKPQQHLYEEIIETHRRAGCAPPMVDQIAVTAGTRRSVVPKLVELAIAQGHLVRVCAQWCLHAEVEREVRRILEVQLGQSSFAVRDLRELLNASRKYLVPLCEYLDRIGFTRREGNLRTIIGRAAEEAEDVQTDRAQVEEVRS